MVLANFGVWCGVILGIGIKKVFFGQLRGVEYEVSRLLGLQAEREERCWISFPRSGDSLWSVLGWHEKNWGRS
jgi:hypothetical protein